MVQLNFEEKGNVFKEVIDFQMLEINENIAQIGNLGKWRRFHSKGFLENDDCED